MKLCPVCGTQYPDTTSLCSQDGVALQSLDDPLIGQTLAEKYLIETLIRRGGMGAVYRGRHILMDKVVAIKVLRPSLAADSAVVTRFSREAKAASRISHPHAVSVTDFGEAESGVVFLVMEFLDGRTLKDKIKAEGPLPIEFALETVRQIAGALDVAHAQRVIHRDLKSENVMLVRHDGVEWAKVLDFGIAKIQLAEGERDPGLTSPNLIIGTPQYMSPEQCSEGEVADYRSDIYSLGVILFEMLTGRVPFTGKSSTSVMMKHVSEPAPSVLALRPELPVGVGDVIARALAKRPEERFQKAGDFADALARAVDGREAMEDRPEAPPQTSAQTRSIEPVPMPGDSFDEITVVRAPVSTSHSRLSIPAEAPVVAPNRDEFNPWRIILPSAAALVLVFAGVFLLTRSSGQTQSPNASQSGLAVDPNAQPVEAGAPPSGEDERGISANPVSTPTPASANANVNANADSGPPTNVNAGGDANVNADPANKNTKQAREVPSPNVLPPAKQTASPPALTKPSPEAANPKPSPSIIER